MSRVLPEILCVLFALFKLLSHKALVYLGLNTQSPVWLVRSVGCKEGFPEAHRHTLASYSRLTHNVEKCKKSIGLKMFSL